MNGKSRKQRAKQVTDYTNDPEGETLGDLMKILEAIYEMRLI